MTDDLELTKTEKIVYKLLLQGLNAKEISEKLVVSLYTAKTHINNILKKTKTKSVQKILAKKLITMEKEFEMVTKQYESVIKQNKELQQEIRYLKERFKNVISSK